MKKIKVYIVTYKRSDILNDTLEVLFASDFKDIENTEVNIINNHSEFSLSDKFVDKVNVLHNSLRPDFSNGNLGENWNQALVNGFKDLSNPDAEYVVTMQNDTVVAKDCFSNLMKMHEQYNFVVGKFGDNFVSYTAEAVKKIGLWDENFAGIQYKEADYWLRALIFNKEKSCINDTLHGLELNNTNALDLDLSEGRNFQVEKTLKEKVLQREGTLKRKADDEEHQEIWATRGGIYKEHSWRYFAHKWSGTWKEEPQKVGWVKYWSEEIVNNPPDFSKSRVQIYFRYTYFEKDLYELSAKNYLV